MPDYRALYEAERLKSEVLAQGFNIDQVERISKSTEELVAAMTRLSTTTPTASVNSQRPCPTFSGCNVGRLEIVDVLSRNLWYKCPL